MGYRFIVLALILAANGFFAAAEVSLVSVRQSSLRALAERGVAGAQAALSLLARPSRLLSVTQVGVTLASLGLGWAGEDTLYHLLMDALEPVHLQISPLLAHFIAFTVASWRSVTHTSLWARSCRKISRSRRLRESPS